MADMSAKAGPKTEATLAIDGVPTAPRRALTAKDVGEDNVAGQFSAVINVHNCTIQQIEVALANNLHEVDPHPIQQGKFVRRHPIYIVAVDYSKRDENGNPQPGAPLELDLDTIRRMHASRYKRYAEQGGDPVPEIAEGDPPEDASHINVPGMHFVAELDSSGRPTGAVRLGNPEDIERQAR